ncbi:MerR family transcriptional regulator [Bacillus sp. 1P06AnD]|uniref:MerR family transcriptional regulator n=1 Tax=Bacillus sp. 1P06AnD TaxID=3132208 RepID=UPI0039A16C0E
MIVLEVRKMLINETSKITNLTKKAIDYYIERNLISPETLGNGYRNFSEKEVDRLKRISVLRRLGLSIAEIQEVLSDETKNALKRLGAQTALDIQNMHARKTIIDKLSVGKDYTDILDDLKAMEDRKTITEKILSSFPGYYGRFICMHFARFLNEPIKTVEQQSAYEEIIQFLDNAPELPITDDLKAFLIESTKHIGNDTISEIIQTTKQSIENPDRFLTNNKEIIEAYLAHKQTEEYKKSPIHKIKSLLIDFNHSSGYYDIFIPAMKKLSPSYADYYRNVEITNQRLLSLYPDIAKWNKE